MPKAVNILLRPSLLGWRPSLLGWRPSLLVARSYCTRLEAISSSYLVPIQARFQLSQTRCYRALEKSQQMEVLVFWRLRRPLGEAIVAQKNGAGHVLYEMPGEVSCIPWPSNIQTLIHLFHQRPRTDHGPHGKLN